MGVIGGPPGVIAAATEARDREYFTKASRALLADLRARQVSQTLSAARGLVPNRAAASRGAQWSRFYEPNWELARKQGLEETLLSMKALRAKGLEGELALDLAEKEMQDKFTASLVGAGAAGLGQYMSTRGPSQPTPTNIYTQGAVGGSTPSGPGTFEDNYSRRRRRNF